MNFKSRERVLKHVGLTRKGANLNSIERVAEYVNLELCVPSDKSAKVSDFECFRSSGMSF